MKDMVKDYLVQERGGFSGVNHVLIAIGLFLVLLLIPIEPFSSFLTTMAAEPVTGVLAFLVIVGAALLPDMDNLKSDGGSVAVWELGFIGTLISSIMVTISSIITSIFRTKKDMKPDTQHRYFWHTLLIPIVIFLLILFGVPGGSGRLADGVTWDSTPYIITTAFIVICVYIGACLLLKKLFKILPFRSNTAILVSLALAAGTGFICVTQNYSGIRMLGFCIAIGYFFHLAGDLFADSGIPAGFPLTGLFPGKFWQRICLIGPFSVTTGSVIEGMLKFVFLAVDIVLALLVFCPQLLQI